jgi:hypothetical protein
MVWAVGISRANGWDGAQFAILKELAKLIFGRKAKLSGCETSLALSAIRRALMMSPGPARPEGLALARAGLAVSRSATT